MAPHNRTFYICYISSYLHVLFALVCSPPSFSFCFYTSPSYFSPLIPARPRPFRNHKRLPSFLHLKENHHSCFPSFTTAISTPRSSSLRSYFACPSSSPSAITNACPPSSKIFFLKYTNSSGTPPTNTGTGNLESKSHHITTLSSFELAVVAIDVAATLAAAAVVAAVAVAAAAAEEKEEEEENAEG